MTKPGTYRDYELRGVLPSEIEWALRHDAVHGIGYALETPVAVLDTTDDPDDARKTYLISADPEHVANAVVEINEYVIEQVRGSADELDADGFVRALSRASARSV